jgi:hypothetical protein
VAPVPDRLWESTWPEPKQPVLLAGPRSVAVLSGAGDFHLQREFRGLPTECAGVSAYGLRLSSAWSIAFGTGSTLRPLAESMRTIRVGRAVLESEHVADGLELAQVVYPTTEPAGVIRELRLRGNPSRPATLECRLLPQLMPLLLEGTRPYRFRAQAGRGELRVSAGRSTLRWCWDPAPSLLLRDARPWNGRRFVGEVGEVAARWEFPSSAGRETRLRLGLVAGAGATRRSPGGRASAEAHFADWVGGTPQMTLPHAPLIEAGYALARSALRSLYYAPAPGFTGLRAGAPWYGTLWCRDLAWMLPAVEWMGDAAWAEASLQTVFGFQARQRVPLLGAEAGELPMQVSPGPVFLFGTSDTTLYYPALLARHAVHTGSPARLPALGRALVLTRQYLLSRSDPRTGLFRHGGEVAALEEATAGLSRIRFGIDAPDTTIWDSADRRDSAVDIQVLGAGAWKALGELEARAGRSAEAADARARAGSLAARLEGTYRWPDERYLVDTLRGGVPVRRLRPNALRAVAAGLVSPELGRQMVRRAAEPDLSTAWGVRTLSDRDPAYDPLAYHGGQVWPLATGWAAEAALAAGETALGLVYLGRLARTLLEERGYANECYRGDRPEPWNSCFLLGFSVAPLLTVLFERLWGIRPHLDRGEVELAPGLPEEWERGSLRGVRLGGGRLDLELSRESLTARYEGTAPVSLVGPGSLRSPAGRSARLELPRPRKGS